MRDRKDRECGTGESEGHDTYRGAEKDGGRVWKGRREGG